MTDSARALIDLARDRARRDYLSFLDWTWMRREPLRIGRHTRAVCERLTRAVMDYLDGRSTYLIVAVPFRHGKSDMVSRYFPPYFLGRTMSADMSADVVVASYSASLAETFSRFSKTVIRSQAYRELFPSVGIARGRDNVAEWGLDGSVGNVIYVGLDGSITGKGGNLIVLDDYCKNREDAYSATMREKAWSQFSTDLMSRRQEPCIVVVCATPWHPDDIIGRIREASRKEEGFPKFEELVFPASKDGEWETLFPEMYSAGWYRSQRATLGPMMSAALLDCNPVGDSNRMFKAEWLQFFDRPPDVDDLNVYVTIDSANSKRRGADTDFTVMCVWGLGRDKNYYLLDGLHDRLNLDERTKALFEIVERWHPLLNLWEQVGAMSDVQHVQLEQERLGYHFPIIQLSQRVPKTDRIGWLVPLFEAGRVWLPRSILRRRVDGSIGDFVAELIKDEYSTFPASRHDDMLDDMANIMHPTFVASTSFPEGRRMSKFAGIGDMLRKTGATA